MNCSATDEQLGRRIIDAIVAGSLMHAICAEDEDHGVVVVWRENAAEQLGAMVKELKTTGDSHGA